MREQIRSATQWRSRDEFCDGYGQSRSWQKMTEVPKSEVPKIVYDRLRTAAPEPDSNAVARPHPDADLLTAFAEQALSAPELEEVRHHLA